MKTSGAGWIGAVMNCRRNWRGVKAGCRRFAKPRRPSKPKRVPRRRRRVSRPRTPPDKAQRHFTDPEAKIQKTADGFIQGYNAQLAVDAAAQIIVAQHVTAAAPDVQQLVPLVLAITNGLHRKPTPLLADAGYWSESNVPALERKDIEPFIATGRRKHGEPPSAAPRGRRPAGLSVKERMQRTLATLRGQAIYARRKAIVEPVIGQIKHARSFR
jgi:hypothetical protein